MAVPNGGDSGGGGGQDGGAALASSQVHSPTHANSSNPSQDEARRAPHCAMQRPPEVPVGGAVPESAPPPVPPLAPPLAPPPALDSGTQLKSQPAKSHWNFEQKSPGQIGAPAVRQEVPVLVHVLVCGLHSVSAKARGPDSDQGFFLRGGVGHVRSVMRVRGGCANDP